MREKKYYIALDGYERGVLLKIINAKIKKFKVITKGCNYGKGYL